MPVQIHRLGPEVDRLYQHFLRPARHENLYERVDLVFNQNIERFPDLYQRQSRCRHWIEGFSALEHLTMPAERDLPLLGAWIQIRLFLICLLQGNACWINRSTKIL